jgi:nucleotide-binding universal stress UspA family protein
VYRAIVVGTDGSDAAVEAVARAAELARAFGARLLVVSAYAPAAGMRLRDEALQREGASTDLRWAVRAREEVDATLADAADRARAEGVDAEAFPRQGDPADAILDVAEEEGADLIVVGNKGQTGAERFLLGSVPNKVSHHAPCSVLIIRTT